MVTRKCEVGDVVVDKARVPSIFREGALMLQRLATRGVLQDIAERVRVDRQGGFSGIDGLVFLLLYYTGCAHQKLRAVDVMDRDAKVRLGAVADRDTVMSQSSVSRLLAAVEEAEVGRFIHWLLLEATGVKDVLRSAVAQVVDAQGVPVRVLAFDPVRLGVRLRGLPEGEDLPTPSRRARRIGAPGRLGRKRGEAVWSAGMLEDLGTGAVLDVQIHPGNGPGRSMLQRAVEKVLATLESLGEPIARAILVADGEFGTVPYLSMVIDAGLPYVSRGARYELLKDPVIWERLRNARWERVHDSKSGPVRYAADVGTVRIPPGVNTRRDDGTPYKPVDVRLVVSRYSATEDAPGCGKQIDEHRYELFVAVGVPASSFPGAELVALFYARCGQECSFQQHQKDLGVQRLIAMNPGGQLFAWAVAFFVWNLRLAAGVQLSAPLPARAAPARRVVELGSPPDLPSHLAEAASEPVATASAAPDKGDLVSTVGDLDTVLAGLRWSDLLRRRQGWSWDGGLRTPDGLLLSFAGVEWIAHRAKLRFIRHDQRRTQATVAVPPHLARAIEAAQRGEQVPDTGTADEAVPQSAATKPSQPPHSTTWLLTPATDEDPVPYAIGWPQLLTARARLVLREAAELASVQVRYRTAKPRSAHPLLEPDRARRQHRRLTWTERVARHAARHPTSIHITTPSTAMAAWLAPHEAQPPRPTM
jgi:hypothetical protein